MQEQFNVDNYFFAVSIDHLLIRCQISNVVTDILVSHGSIEGSNNFVFILIVGIFYLKILSFN